MADTSGSISAFERMEAKADAMLDKANAMSELNQVGGDSIDDLASKYDAAPSADVQDELAALKAKMGLS
jgi:phage shock protein A